MYPQHRKMATEEGKETCPWSRRDAGDIRAHSLKKRTSTQQAVHLCLCDTEHVRPGDRSGPSLLQRRRQRPETRRDFPKSPARQRQSRGASPGRPSEIPRGSGDRNGIPPLSAQHLSLSLSSLHRLVSQGSLEALLELSEQVPSARTRVRIPPHILAS